MGGGSNCCDVNTHACYATTLMGCSCDLTATCLCAPGKQCCVNTLPPGMPNNYTICACSVGTVPRGGTCTQMTECVPGNICVVPKNMATGTCQPWCTLPNGPCPTGMTCQMLLNPAPGYGMTTYGVCN
jgi:hypothetical protein